jgi:predicted MFS family arabinose efflux permease
MRCTSTRPTEASSYRALLASPAVGALLLATLLSRLAGRMFALSIVLYALLRTGSPVLAGWLAFAAVAPGLVVSPLAGALIDRVGSAWAVTVDMAASAACVLALIVLDQLGWTPAPALLTLTGVYSLTSPLSMAGIRAMLPGLVPMDARDRANALDTAIHGLTDIAGPATAGALVGLAGPVTALGLIALAFIAAAICLGRVRQPRAGFPGAKRLLVQAWHGLSLVMRQKTLRGLAIAYSLYEVSWGVLIVAVPVSAARHYPGGAGAAAAGMLWAVLGLVGGVAALVAGHWRTAGRERGVMALGMLATALALWPFAACLGLAGLAFAMMLVGAAAGPIDVGVLTLRQRRTDPRELGRVLSVSMSLNMAGGPLGSALGGALIAWSPTAAFTVAAASSVLAAAAAVALIPARDDADRS